MGESCLENCFKKAFTMFTNIEVNKVQILTVMTSHSFHCLLRIFKIAVDYIKTVFWYFYFLFLLNQRILGLENLRNHSVEHHHIFFLLFFYFLFFFQLSCSHLSFFSSPCCNGNNLSLLGVLIYKMLLHISFHVSLLRILEDRQI